MCLVATTQRTSACTSSMRMVLRLDMSLRQSVHFVRALFSIMHGPLFISSDRVSVWRVRKCNALRCLAGHGEFNTRSGNYSHVVRQVLLARVPDWDGRKLTVAMRNRVGALRASRVIGVDTVCVDMGCAQMCWDRIPLSRLALLTC